VSARRVTAKYLIRTWPQKERPQQPYDVEAKFRSCDRYDRHDKGDEQPSCQTQRDSTIIQIC
jgi:hypothetical protein